MVNDILDTPGVAFRETNAEGQALLATAVAIERLRAGRSTVLRINGRSMYPYLVPGQRALLEPCAARVLQRGDIAAFERHGRVVLHRVLRVNLVSGQVIEKGDNLRQAEVINELQVLGRVSAILSARPIALRGKRYTRQGRWLADLSAAHAKVHHWALRIPVGGRWLDHCSTLLFRLAVVLARPPR